MNNLPILVQKGINIKGLLESNVFSMKLNFPGWPITHSNLQECIRPYNGSFFQIRHMYREVFPEPEFEPLSTLGKSFGTGESKVDSRKIYKIKYSVNLLP